MMHTEKLIKQALLACVPIVLVINKVDRLVLELKLPPQDAYYKLVHTIEEVNKIIAANTPATSGEREREREQCHQLPTLLPDVYSIFDIPYSMILCPYACLLCTLYVFCFACFHSCLLSCIFSFLLTFLHSFFLA